MNIALAQINTTIGDFQRNEEKILEAYRRGVQQKADLVVLPELAVCGYPPRDLLLQSSFLRQNQAAVDRLAQATGATGLLVGYAGVHEGSPGRPATNAAALLHQGAIVATRTKTLLPTYDVFDEDRYFEPATRNDPIQFLGHSLGVTICEDVWNDEDFWPQRRYRANPATALVEAGAEILFNLSASPWHLGKNRLRHQMLAQLAAKLGRPLVYCNLVGGNDELVFDGTSLVFDARGQLVLRGTMFREDWMMVNLDRAEPLTPPETVDEEKVFDSLALGLRDYLHKCGFTSAVLGLSGGIDSAVTAAIAAHALGSEHVRGVAMPSRYSSQGSLDDARQLASNLGIRYDVVPIDPMFTVLKAQLKDLFSGRAEDTTEENMQARIRGVVLMSISNKFGSLLLTTGNKSELAVGYCTLYGDMCGGLAVISDVPKTIIYKLARWINRDRELIPQASIDKAPSAELRPHQTDQDTLPPYEVLDAILEAYVVQGRPLEEILQCGQAEATVRRVLALIDRNEYKRRQAAPGLKITSKAFGVGRRIPVAQRYRP